MGAFKRSWFITKLSIKVIKKDKELLLFPLLAGIFSILFMGALLFPTVVSSIISSGQFTHSIINYVLLFITYLGLAFIATFFNVCVVYTVKRSLESKQTTFFQSIGFALSRVHLILMWSLLAAIVGLLLHLLTEATKKMKGVGRIIFRIINALLGMAWGILTIFVVPGMVYHNLGPIDALKKSAITLRKTWGESLIRHLGIGMVTFVFLLLAIVVSVVLIFLGSLLGIIGLITMVSVSVILILGVILFFKVVNTVFNTVLYVYADTGKIAEGYTEDILHNAFKSKR